jgi:hypothetical protein
VAPAYHPAVYVARPVVHTHLVHHVAYHHSACGCRT